MSFAQVAEDNSLDLILRGISSSAVIYDCFVGSATTSSSLISFEKRLKDDGNSDVYPLPYT